MPKRIALNWRSRLCLGHPHHWRIDVCLFLSLCHVCGKRHSCNNYILINNVTARIKNQVHAFDNNRFMQQHCLIGSRYARQIGLERIWSSEVRLYRIYSFKCARITTNVDGMEDLMTCMKNKGTNYEGSQSSSLVLCSQTLPAYILPAGRIWMAMRDYISTTVKELVPRPADVTEQEKDDLMLSKNQTLKASLQITCSNFYVAG